MVHEKSRNLTQNYENLDEFGGFWKILGSQKIFFIKWGVVISGKWRKKGTREYPINKMRLRNGRKFTKSVESLKKFNDHFSKPKNQKYS